MWGSGVILAALLLTLDQYSSWRVGRVVPMIRSAVRTLRSLLRSDLVAELMHTERETHKLHVSYWHHWTSRTHWNLLQTTRAAAQHINTQELNTEPPNIPSALMKHPHRNQASAVWSPVSACSEPLHRTERPAVLITVCTTQCSPCWRVIETGGRCVLPCFVLAGQTSVTSGHTSWFKTSRCITMWLERPQCDRSSSGCFCWTHVQTHSSISTERLRTRVRVTEASQCSSTYR